MYKYKIYKDFGYAIRDKFSLSILLYYMVAKSVFRKEMKKTNFMNRITLIHCKPNFKSKLSRYLIFGNNGC